MERFRAATANRQKHRRDRIMTDSYLRQSFFLWVTNDNDEYQLRENLTGDSRSAAGYCRFDRNPDQTLVLKDLNIMGDEKEAAHMTVPEAVRDAPIAVLEDSAFNGLEKLRSISFGREVRRMEGNPVFHCPTLERIEIHPGNRFFKMTGNCLMTADGKRLLCHLPAARERECTVPEGTEVIAKNAFNSCRNLERIVLPDTVRRIEEGAFFQCFSLREIRLPDGLTEIPEWAFFGCSGLKSFTVPVSVKTVSDFAFGECDGLEEVILPECLDYLGAFVFAGCKSLKKARVPDEIEDMGDNIFEECPVEKELPEEFQSIPPEDMIQECLSEE